MNLKNFFEKNQKIKKLVGVVLIVVGLLALITPFTPGSWLVFVGLGLLGFRLAFYERFIDWWKRR